MSLKQNIINKLNNSGKKTTLQQLYLEFPNTAKTTIRGRVYDSLGKGITRVGKGLYISSQAIIEHGNSLDIIDRMIKEGDKFNFIFLDIPYKASGQKGGNRNLFDKNKITISEFGEFIRKAEQLLVDDNSIIAFMFTTGKTSQRAFQEYVAEFNLAGLYFSDKIGKYTKIWANGNRINMGKYLMPIENIYFFSRSGQVNIDELEFSLVPKMDYPTGKPYPMIESLVRQLTKVNDWVFDPFGGSGQVLKACNKLGRYCHIIDICPQAFNNHLLKIELT